MTYKLNRSLKVIYSYQIIYFLMALSFVRNLNNTLFEQNNFVDIFVYLIMIISILETFKYLHFVNSLCDFPNYTKSSRTPNRQCQILIDFRN